MTAELINRLAKLSSDLPSKPALQCGGEILRYENLYREIDRQAENFARDGLESSDRVSLRVSNSFGDVIRILALCRHGVPLLLVDRNATDDERGRAEKMFEATIRFTGTELARVGEARLRSDIDQSVCFVTSGVTGRPKLVKVNWGGLVRAARRFSLRYGLCSDDKVLCTTSISHSYGFCVGIVGPLASGATVALVGSQATGGGLAAAIRHYQPSIVQSVPFYYRLLTEARDLDLNSVRMCISAGEAISATLTRKWNERGYPRLCNHYGATEVGQVSIELDGVAQSVGYPIEGFEVEVRRSDRLDPGTEENRLDGEIWVRAAGVPSAYLGNASNEDPSRNAGWFRTGDIGRFDGDGRLLITGRLVNRINVGGRKVDPREVEETIRLYPGVTDCAVIGHQSTDTAEQVYAYVQGDVPDTGDLLRFLRTHLSAYKVPRVVRSVNQIPRTISGKVRYGVLQDVPVK